MQATRVVQQHAEDSDLETRLRNWVAAGLLSADQAEAIRHHEAREPAVRPGRPSRPTRPPRRAHRPSPAEGLGYVGGVLALAGVLLLLSRYWPQMSSAEQLVLSGVATALLLGAGAAVQPGRNPAYQRLRAALWLAAAGTISAFAVVAVRAAESSAATAVLVFAGAAAAAVLSLALWHGSRERPVQQLAFLAATEVAIGAAIAVLVPPPGWSGVGVVAGGLVLFVVGRLRLVPAAVPTEGVGILGAIVGGSLITAEWNGVGLLTLTTSAAVLLGMALLPGLSPTRTEQLLCGVSGALITVETVPSALGYFAAEAALASGTVAALVGALLVVAGERRLTRLPAVVSACGGVLLLVGAAVTWNQVHGLAPLLGIVAGLALIGIGLAWDSVRLTLLGSLGLLANVLWALAWFFPGRARAPLLAVVAGAIVIAIAVLLREANRHSRRSPPSDRGGRR